MKRKIYIGCSGYYYGNWRKEFYQDKPVSKWLSEYSSAFNTVELNGTFYKVPTLENLKKQADQTPADFKFSAKQNRYVTHIKRLKNKEEINSFEHLLLSGLGNKLENILFQMPPSFHYNEANLRAIENNIPDSDLNAIEFRHISWWNETVFRFFRSHRYVFCNVDFPGLQPAFVHGGEKFYLRLHGVPQLFVSSYSSARLQELAGEMTTAYNTYCIYFNNTAQGNAYRNALELREILRNTFTP